MGVGGVSSKKKTNIQSHGVKMFLSLAFTAVKSVNFESHTEKWKKQVLGYIILLEVFYNSQFILCKLEFFA